MENNKSDIELQALKKVIEAGLGKKLKISATNIIKTATNAQKKG